MSDGETAFDPIRIIVDWLDACYAHRATLYCCDGRREQFWISRSRGIPLGGACFGCEAA